MTARTAPVLCAMLLLLASACAKRAAHDSSMAPGEHEAAGDDLAALDTSSPSARINYKRSASLPRRVAAPRRRPPT